MGIGGRAQSSLICVRQLGERVEYSYARRCKMRDVARDDGEIVNQRRCGDLLIVSSVADPLDALAQLANGHERK